jgi:hypothetical protein
VDLNGISLSPGQTVVMKVSAVTAQGETNYSDPAEITFQTIPGIVELRAVYS